MEVGGKISGFIDGFLGKENVEAFNNLGNKNVEGSKNVGKLPGGQDAKTMQVTGRLKQIGIVAASVLAGIVTFGAGAAIAFEALVKIATPNNEGGKPTDQASAKAEIKGQEILGASSVQKQNSTEDPRKEMRELVEICDDLIKINDEFKKAGLNKNENKGFLQNHKDKVFEALKKIEKNGENIKNMYEVFKGDVAVKQEELDQLEANYQKARTESPEKMEAIKSQIKAKKKEIFEFSKEFDNKIKKLHTGLSDLKYFLKILETPVNIDFDSILDKFKEVEGFRNEAKFEKNRLDDAKRAETSFTEAEVEQKLGNALKEADSKSQETPRLRAKGDFDFMGANSTEQNKSVLDVQAEKQKNGKVVDSNSFDEFSPQEHGVNGAAASLTNFLEMKGGENQDRVGATKLNIKVGENSIEVPMTFVLDGHGGVGGCDFVKENLPKFLAQELSGKDELTDTIIFTAIRLAFFKCNEALREKDPNAKNGGTTAVISLDLNGSLWVANVGDSGAILVPPQGEATQLSAANTLTESQEPTKDNMRAIKRGGIIARDFGTARLFGRDTGGSNSELGASFGDFRTPGVTALPKITRIPKNEIPKGSVLVSYTDAVSNVATKDDLRLVVQEGLQRGASPLEIAKGIVFRAQNVNSNVANSDDASAVVAFIGGK